MFTTRRDFLVGSGAALSTEFLPNGLIAQPSGAPLLIKMGGAPVVPYSNSMIADEAGFFAKQGLTVQRRSIFAADVARTALISGDIEVAAMAIDTLIRGHMAGFDWRLLYQASVYDPAKVDAGIVARSNLAINEPKDLEGKSVALISGSIGEPSFKAWLRSKGGDPAKVRIVEMAFPQMLGALEANSIDAAYVVDPFLATGIESGKVKMVGANLDIVGGRFLVSGYVAKASWIEANPEKAKRFTDAVAAGTQFILARPEEALPIVAKNTRLAPELVSKFFPKRYTAPLSIEAVEIQRPIDFLAREKFIDAAFSYRDIVSSYMPVEG
jgi:NitT/TauT family transport system substrate-binding protein